MVMVMVIMVVDILAKEMVRVVVETLMLMLTLDVVYGKEDDDDGDDDDDHRVRLFLQDTSPQKLARAGGPEPNWDVKEPAIGIKFAN